jgi:hypothetical protein
MRKALEGRVVDFLKSQDNKFLDACSKVNVKSSRRQASKWLNQKGKAWNEIGRFPKCES